MSFSAFAAAIAPNVAGSSTMGGKKSVVTISACSSDSRYTAASSAGASPTRRSSLATGAKPARSSRRRAAEYFAAQPPPASSPAKRVSVATERGYRSISLLSSPRTGCASSGTRRGVAVYRSRATTERVPYEGSSCFSPSRSCFPRLRTPRSSRVRRHAVPPAARISRRPAGVTQRSGETRRRTPRGDAVLRGDVPHRRARASGRKPFHDVLRPFPPRRCGGRNRARRAQLVPGRRCGREPLGRADDRGPHAFPGPATLAAHDPVAAQAHARGGGEGGCQATPVASTNAPVTAPVGDESAWSNWFLFPILGFIAVAAAGFAVRRRRDD